jgi:hypothetical protein
LVQFGSIFTNALVAGFIVLEVVDALVALCGIYGRAIAASVTILNQQRAFYAGFVLAQLKSSLATTCFGCFIVFQIVNTFITFGIGR